MASIHVFPLSMKVGQVHCYHIVCFNPHQPRRISATGPLSISRPKNNAKALSLLMFKGHHFVSPGMLKKVQRLGESYSRSIRSLTVSMRVCLHISVPHTDVSGAFA